MAKALDKEAWEKPITHSTMFDTLVRACDLPLLVWKPCCFK